MSCKKWYLILSVMVLSVNYSGAQSNVKSELVLFDVESKTQRIIWRDTSLIEAPNQTTNKTYIVNSEGKIFEIFPEQNLRKEIYTGNIQNCNNDHDISPDERFLAISSHDSETDNPEPWKTSKVYIVPLKGGEPRLITKNDGSFFHGWSPDGKTLIYTGIRNGQFDIYSIPAEEGNETQITNTPVLDDGSEFSHDGKYIYFNSYRSGSMEIWRVGADGSDPVQLTNDAHSNWFPHPSGDGKTIVYLCFIQDQGDAHPYGQTVKLRLYDIETDEIMDATEEFFGGQGTINVNSWSPDNKTFAFIRYIPVENRDK